MTFIISLLGSLGGSLVNSFAKLFSIETIKFLAWRALILFIVFIALPVVLYNIFTGLIFDFLDYALSFLSSQGLSSHVVSLSGMGAYIASQIRLPEAFSVYLSYVGIAFLMRFIPFFK